MSQRPILITLDSAYPVIILNLLLTFQVPSAIFWWLMAVSHVNFLLLHKLTNLLANILIFMTMAAHSLPDASNTQNCN
jgi:hypothetical protein